MTDATSESKDPRVSFSNHTQLRGKRFGVRALFEGEKEPRTFDTACLRELAQTVDVHDYLRSKYRVECVSKADPDKKFFGPMTTSFLEFCEKMAELLMTPPTFTKEDLALKDARPCLDLYNDGYIILHGDAGTFRNEMEYKDGVGWIPKENLLTSIAVFDVCDYTRGRSEEKLEPFHFVWNDHYRHVQEAISLVLRDRLVYDKTDPVLALYREWIQDLLVKRLGARAMRLDFDAHTDEEVLDHAYFHNEKLRAKIDSEYDRLFKETMAMVTAKIPAFKFL